MRSAQNRRQPFLAFGIGEYTLVDGRFSATAEYGDPIVLRSARGRILVALVHETDAGERISLLNTDSGESILVGQLKPVDVEIVTYEADGTAREAMAAVKRRKASTADRTVTRKSTSTAARKSTSKTGKTAEGAGMPTVTIEEDEEQPKKPAHDPDGSSDEEDEESIVPDDDGDEDEDEDEEEWDENDAEDEDEDEEDECEDQDGEGDEDEDEEEWDEEDDKDDEDG